jgi:Fe-S-cluster-containing dehydrogenase component
MQFDEEKSLAGKCDLCVERVDMGLQPACVAACPSHCIYFGEISRIIEKLGKHELLVWYKAVAQ